MDSVKNRGRKKLFKCFNPNDVVEPSFRTVPLSEDDDDNDDNDNDERKSKKRLPRSFSGSVKAAFSKTTLGKKMRSKKHREGTIRSSSVNVSSPRSENFDAFAKMKKNSSSKDFRDLEESLPTSPSRSSVFTPSLSITPSSSSSSSTCSDSRCNSLERLRPMNIPKPQSLTKRELIKSVYSRIGTSRGGMLSCVVCLVSLVLCGKVFAIMACTAMWLYFAPARKCSRPADDVVDSEENRKKVILEGLLARSRSRIL